MNVIYSMETIYIFFNFIFWNFRFENQGMTSRNLRRNQSISIYFFLSISIESENCFLFFFCRQKTKLKRKTENLSSNEWRIFFVLNENVKKCFDVKESEKKMGNERIIFHMKINFLHRRTAEQTFLFTPGKISFYKEKKVIFNQNWIFIFFSLSWKVNFLKEKSRMKITVIMC